MFLSQARKKHQKVELVLETGTVLRGKLKAYDQFSVTLGFKDQSEVIYKSSIIYMTILPPLHSPSFDRKPRYHSRDNGYRRNYNDENYYDEDDESDERDFEENTRALNSYRKLGDDSDSYRKESYRRDDGESPRRDSGYRRENNYRRDENDGYRRDNGYRRSDSESGYRRDSNYRRDDNDGYRRDGGYKKYDNGYRRSNYNRDNNDEHQDGYQKPYYRRRDEDYDSKPSYQQRKPYNKRDDDDNDPPPPKKVIVKRY